MHVDSETSVGAVLVGSEKDKVSVSVAIFGNVYGLCIYRCMWCSWCEYLLGQTHSGCLYVVIRIVKSIDVL